MTPFFRSPLLFPFSPDRFPHTEKKKKRSTSKCLSTDLFFTSFRSILLTTLFLLFPPSLHISSHFGGSFLGNKAFRKKREDVFVDRRKSALYFLPVKPPFLLESTRTKTCYLLFTSYISSPIGKNFFAGRTNRRYFRSIIFRSKRRRWWKEQQQPTKFFIREHASRRCQMKKHRNYREQRITLTKLIHTRKVVIVWKMYERR